MNVLPAPSPSIPTYAAGDMGTLCTRIKFMSAFLFPAADLEALQSHSRPTDLFEGLLETEYGESLKKEVLEVEDLIAFESRLADTYSRRLAKVQALTRQNAPRYEFIITAQEDLRRVRALIRGCLQPQAASILPPNEVPAGMITMERFRRAASSRNLDTLVHHLSEWIPDLAPALRAAGEPLHEEKPSIRALELATDQFFYHHMLTGAAGRGNRVDAALLRELATDYGDRANLRTALRYLGRHLPEDQVLSLFLAGGQLSLDHFKKIMAADEIDQIFARLKRGPLTRALEKGMLYFVHGGRASIFERFFDEQTLVLKKRLSRTYPVSIATPLYYVARAHNELINLRALLRGMVFDLPKGAVQEKLVYV